MMQNGYLKNEDGISSLSSSTTTIGRENCDIIIDDDATDAQHAVIEYSVVEDCFVLHDLNTVQGTYVNNCRIQNSAVRLAPGDVIKFSHNGKAYELDTGSSCKTHQYLPVQQRPSWTSPIQILVSSPRQERVTQDPCTFPLIGVSSMKSLRNQTPTKMSCVQPHPPLLNRPATTDDLPRGSHGITELGHVYPDFGNPANTEGLLLREKERKIIHMGDEINRLAMFEQESKRKDHTVSCLREEVARLQEQMTCGQQLSSTQVFQKLQGLEKELHERRSEVAILREQLNAVNRGLVSSPTLTSKLAECEKKTHTLRQENDQFRKECAMSQGLVQSLQKELQAKEDSTKKSTAELIHLRREVKRKDVQLSAMSSKFTKLTNDKNKDETIDALRRELKDAKIKQQVVESRCSDQLKLLHTYKDEIGAMQAKHQSSLDEGKTAVKNLEEIKQKYFEVQRSERILRVDIEQNKNRLERFRLRIVNALYSCPSLSIPEDMENVEDGTVVENIKKIIKQRLEMKSKVEEVEEELRKKSSQLQDYTSSFMTCQAAVNEMKDRVTKSGHHTTTLRTEGELLSSLALADQCFAWIYKSFAAFLHSEADWSADLDHALLQAGYDVTIDEKNPASHVSDLHHALLSEKDRHQTTVDTFKQLEARHQEELQSNIDKLLKENEEKLAVQLENVRREEETRFEQSLLEMQRAEEEKRMEALAQEKEKITSASLGIEQLRKMLSEQQIEEKKLKTKLQEAYSNLEAQKNAEKQLNERFAELERDHKLKTLAVAERLEQTKKSYEEDLQQHKEEVRQHSVTIVSMEEKIQVLNHQRQQAEENLASLKSRFKDLEKVKQSQRPPIQVPIPNDQSEQEIAFLKRELFHASQEILTLKDTIVGLRRDLTGSQARISDMTGELSESQKIELEHNRSRCKNQEVELNTIRQKLIKMSSMVDAQKDQIGKLQKVINGYESSTNKSNTESSNQMESIKELKAELEKSKVKSQQQTEARKANISEELSCVGAQCRGERHEEIISRQCEALAELRARVKALEQIRPPLPSQQQALQQVILLKKELAEIRAHQAIGQDENFQAQMSLDNQVQDSQQQLRTATMQASVERTTREQIDASLEASERCYMDTLNSLASILNMSNLHGCVTLQHLPPDEKDRVVGQRREDLEKLCNVVKSTVQQLDRKEQLLQGYEKDLAKLRDAESFASIKSSKVEALSRQLMEKVEEVNHLREALSQINDKLELEKRLNKSIKQRKTFHLENLDYRTPPTPARSSHRMEEEKEKIEKRKGKRNEKLRRKQYEIDVLKQRVYGKERELCDTTARLVNTSGDASDEIAQIHRMREHVRENDLSRDVVLDT